MCWTQRSSWSNLWGRQKSCRRVGLTIYGYFSFFKDWWIELASKVYCSPLKNWPSTLSMSNSCMSWPCMSRARYLFFFRSVGVWIFCLIKYECEAQKQKRGRKLGRKRNKQNTCNVYWSFAWGCLRYMLSEEKASEVSWHSHLNLNHVFVLFRVSSCSGWSLRLSKVWLLVLQVLYSLHFSWLSGFATCIIHWAAFVRI